MKYFRSVDVGFLINGEVIVIIESPRVSASHQSRDYLFDEYLSLFYSEKAFYILQNIKNDYQLALSKWKPTWE